MSNASQSLFGAMDPLPPDQAGYCYLDRDHFNVFTQGIARRLILKHGSFVDRLPLWGMFVFLAAVIITIVLASSIRLLGWILVPQLVSFVLTGWYFTRIRRFVRRMIRQHMCFKCGYSLRRSPTDSAGYGTCSECGQAYHLGYYSHLPRGYKRPRREPDWRDSLHPLDRARMLREPSHAQQRENSDQGHAHPTS